MMGTMSSGKTTHLLQSHFNLNQAFPNQVMLMNKNDRSGDSVCTNRMGGMSLSTGVSEETSLIEAVSDFEAGVGDEVQYLFLDEVQFFSIEQINELPYLADHKHIDVFAYGLLTTYKGNLFPASHRLLEVADQIVHLRNGVRCWCGGRATHNALFKAGKQVSSGDTEVVDNDESVIDYQVMCRKHFLEHVGFNL
jgi:thymidine kinase